MSPHEIVNPPDLQPAVGFAHAVVAAAGRTVWLGGQTAADAEGRIGSSDFVEQFDRALANLVVAIEAAAAAPKDLVSVHLYVTDAQAYRDARKELGRVWRRRIGTYYPAMALFEVRALFDPAARVEIVAVAVCPETRR